MVPALPSVTLMSIAAARALIMIDAGKAVPELIPRLGQVFNSAVDLEEDLLCLILGLCSIAHQTISRGINSSFVFILKGVEIGVDGDAMNPGRQRRPATSTNAGCELGFRFRG